MGTVMKMALRRVERTYGKEGLKLVTPEVHRALVVEQAFYIIAGQDQEEVSDTRVRAIVAQVWDEVTELFPR